ncbi:twin-arginine translocation signal domain-containing protein, partial [Komagataeibacter rhaeticus]|uniref:twin-arginine translocation signal domain-containing protein n=3 Tax=Komagataeibacter rhaeticus TaxID=215221 RepID=UPI001CD2F3F0
MQNPTRRAFLRGSSALVAATALAACTSTKSGTTTTITLNVAEVADYVDALLNFSSTAINMPLVAAAMGAPNVALANT